VQLHDHPRMEHLSPDSLHRILLGVAGRYAECKIVRTDCDVVLAGGTAPKRRRGESANATPVDMVGNTVANGFIEVWRAFEQVERWRSRLHARFMDL